MKTSRFTRRGFLQRSAIAGVGGALAGTSMLTRPAMAALNGPVNALTWGGRVMQDQQDDFLKETGVRVNFIRASGNSENLAQIQLGRGSQYDILRLAPLWGPQFSARGIIEALRTEQW